MKASQQQLSSGTQSGMKSEMSKAKALNSSSLTPHQREHQLHPTPSALNTASTGSL